jgi:signal transduction histidine kinase
MNPFDLRSILGFLPEAGTITIGDQRAMLLNENAFAKLRELLFEQLGTELARSILMKFGYQHALEDYRTLCKLVHTSNDEERLQIGPLMHSWCGIVKVEPLEAQIDRERGHFYFRGIWRNSIEAAAHLKIFGKSTTPVCFSLAGYGSGWCSAFFGMPLIEIETKCVACGDEHCEWEIRPLKDFSHNASPWIKALMDDHKSLAREYELASDELKLLNAELERRISERTKQVEILLRVLCHDLNAPIAVAQSSVAAASSIDPALDTAVQSIAEVVHSVQQQMLGTAQKESQGASFRFSALVQKIQFVFAESLANDGIKLIVENGDSQHERFRGNIDDVFNHIIANAINNAKKYSMPGSFIRVNAKLHGDKGVIAVSDNGIGIPAFHLHRILQEQFDEKMSGLRGEMGTGWGIKIMRHYAALMSGGLTVESKSAIEHPDDHGTTVKLTLDIL